jgi:hypothetical protein
MRRAVLLVAVLAVLAGCGGSSTPKPTLGKANGPGVFMTRILREEISGQWSAQWRDLHPGHKKLISRSEYVACSQRMGTDFATGDEVFKVLDVRTDPIKVRGVPQRISSLVTITFHRPGKAQGLTYHMHAVNVGGHWKWILGKPFLSALARGRCLDGSPLQTTA